MNLPCLLLQGAPTVSPLQISDPSFSTLFLSEGTGRCHCGPCLPKDTTPQVSSLHSLPMLAQHPLWCCFSWGSSCREEVGPWFLIRFLNISGDFTCAITKKAAGPSQKLHTYIKFLSYNYFLPFSWHLSMFVFMPSKALQSWSFTMFGDLPSQRLLE